MKSRKRMISLLFALLFALLVAPAKQMLLREQSDSFHHVLKTESKHVSEFMINGLQDSVLGIDVIKRLASQHDVNVMYNSSDALLLSKNNASNSVMVFAFFSDSRYLNLLPINQNISLSEFNQLQKPIVNTASNDMNLEIIDIGWTFYLAPIDLYDGQNFSGVLKVSGNLISVENFRNDFQLMTQSHLLPHQLPEDMDRYSKIPFRIRVNTLLQDWMISIVTFLLIIMIVYISYLKRKDTAVKRLHGYSSLSIVLQQSKDILTMGLLLLLPIYLIAFLVTSNLSFRFVFDVLPHFISLLFIIISFIFFVLILSGVALSLIRPSDVLKNYGRNDGFVWIMTVIKILILLLVLNPITSTLAFVNHMGTMIQANQTYSHLYDHSYTLTAKSDSVDQLLRLSEQIYPILNESHQALAIRYSFFEGSEELGPYRAHVNRNYIQYQKMTDEQGNIITSDSVNEATIIVSQSLKSTLNSFLAQSPENCRQLMTSVNDCSDIHVIYTASNVSITPYFYTYDPPSQSDLELNYILIPYDLPFPFFNLFFELDDSNHASLIVEQMEPYIATDRVMVVNLAFEAKKEVRNMIYQLIQSVLMIVIYSLMIVSVLAGIYLMLFDSRKRTCAIKYTFGIRSWQTLLNPLLIQMLVTQVIIFSTHRLSMTQNWKITILAAFLIALMEISLFLFMSLFIESRLSSIVKRGI